MSSGIKYEHTVNVGRYSHYSVGRPWASGEGYGEPICYAPVGWREDAGETPIEFRPLAEVVESACGKLRGYFPKLREATLAFLRNDPFGVPRWEDGLDWTMCALEAAYHVTGSRVVAQALVEQPEFQSAWLAALAA